MNADTYVKVSSGIFGVYGLIMLGKPSMIHTDHFNSEPTPTQNFWIRGHGVSILAAIAAFSQLPAESAAKIITGYSAAVTLVYPYNAKTGGYGGKLDAPDKETVKYPMHYVPEVLMPTLVLAGAAVLALKK